MGTYGKMCMKVLNREVERGDSTKRSEKQVRKTHLATLKTCFMGLEIS